MLNVLCFIIWIKLQNKRSWIRTWKCNLNDITNLIYESKNAATFWKWKRISVNAFNLNYGTDSLPYVINGTGAASSLPTHSLGCSLSEVALHTASLPASLPDTQHPVLGRLARPDSLQLRQSSRSRCRHQLGYRELRGRRQLAPPSLPVPGAQRRQRDRRYGHRRH